MRIREDLKNSPEYLNEVIGVLGGSLDQAQKRIKELEEKLDQSEQDAFVELQDQINMLNRRFFSNGLESLQKQRPPKNYDRELLPHNVPPLDATTSKVSSVPEVEIIHDEVSCPCCGSENLEVMKGQFDESSEIDLIEKSAIRKHHKRQKYRCKTCEKIVTAKGAAKVKKGAKYSIDFCVSTAVD